jgi:hypothetical protein
MRLRKRDAYSIDYNRYRPDVVEAYKIFRNIDGTFYDEMVTWEVILDLDDEKNAAMKLLWLLNSKYYRQGDKRWVYEA